MDLSDKGCEDGGGDGTGSGFCPMAGFDTSNVETFGSATRELVHWEFGS